MATSNTQQVKQTLATYMLEAGKKNTRQRDLIVDVFLEMEGHVSLQELLTEVQKHNTRVGFATIYRTMKLLKEADVAYERHFGDGQARYEVREFGEHHDHLICTVCQHIFEFEDMLIERRQLEIATQHGLRIESHRHEIYGECLEPETCPNRSAAEERRQG